MEASAAARPPPNSVISKMQRIVLSANQFRTRVRGIALATWLVSPLIGVGMLSFLGIYGFGELIFALTNISMAYWILFATLSIWLLDKRAASLVAALESQGTEYRYSAEPDRAVMRIVRDFLVLFALFCLLAPLSVEISMFVFADHPVMFSHYLQGMAGIVPVMLIVAFPAFFFLIDALGAYAAPCGVRVNLFSLRTRIMVVGLVTPVLIDLTLLLYFYDRTAYLSFETLALWLGLLILAGIGAMLAWNSLARSLKPMEIPFQDWEIGSRSNFPDAPMKPVSLDELGAVADGWRRMMARSREQEMRFRDLIEGSIQGVLVHRENEIIFANRALLDMLRYESVDELVAQGDVLSFVHEDDRKRLKEYREQRFAGGTAPSRYEFRIVASNGATIWVENVVRMVEWEGEKAIQATFVDITDRKLAEVALRESEASLKEAQRIAGIGNWDWYILDGKLHWSDQIYRIFGVEPDAFPATYEAFLDHIHPDDGDLVKQAVAAALAGEAPYVLDHRIVLGEGTVKIVHEQAEVERDDSGNPVRMSGTVQDVTELRRAEAEIRRLNEELEARVEQRTQELREAQAELIKKDRLVTLGQLTATVSHELRNPLGAMRTSTYVLSKTLKENEEQVLKAIDRIERGIRRCDRIIDELLDFTRSATIERQIVIIDDWLSSLLSEMSIPKGIDLRTDLQLGQRSAAIDPESMRRAVINIFENACQAIEGQAGWDANAGGGVVLVSTSEADRRIEIRIADNGPGISVDPVNKIFEPLFSTKNFGVGLGLPTVRQILERHGGEVAVHPADNQGSGTAFTLAFPCGATTETPNEISNGRRVDCRKTGRGLDTAPGDTNISSAHPMNMPDPG